MKLFAKIVFVCMFCLVSLLIAVGVGSVPVRPTEVAIVLGSKLFGIPLPADFSQASISILWTIRLPRVLIAFCVGAMLSVSGAVMQSVLRNPLASSYTLGVSSGASLGASVILLTGFTLPIIGNFTLPFVGLLSGIASVFIAVLFASRVDPDMQNNTIILSGMVFSLFVSAILTLVYCYAKQEIQKLLQWQMGSFARKSFSEVGLLLPIGLIGMLLLLWYAREMDMLTFGEAEASAMGLNTKRVKWVLLSVSAVLTGSAVAFSGVIGFVDLIVPHTVRKFFGARHTLVIPMSALVGGGFMALCDTIARTIVSPLELPVGAVTALIGAPFFIYVYFIRKRERDVV